MFCESCGQNIADYATRCPHCGESTGIVPPGDTKDTDVAPVHVQHRQTANERAPSKLTRAEQTIYFRLARGFSWFLLIIISVALAMGAVRLIPIISQVVGTSTDVSAKDLTRVMTSPRGFGSADDDNDLNPAEMAQLDQVAYEIIQLLPVDARANQNIDYLRGQIKNSAGNLSQERKAQLAILHELRDDLREIPETQRGNAFGTYFNLKSQRIQSDRAKKTEAMSSLVLLGSSMLSGIALLTLITMILVLLSIERNTRSLPG
jgi:hypothetical protein